jgi:molybdopterin-binding protein
MAQPILQVENLSHQYHDGFSLQIEHFVLYPGRAYALTGPNGSGKTTLLHILGLLTAPQKCRLTFEEKQISMANAKEAWHYRRQVTLVMQRAYLLRTSVFNNVAYGLQIRGLKASLTQTRVLEMLKKVGLTGYETRSVHRLSGGETQRVALARALVLEPKILLLDEPTANIDEEHVARIESIIEEAREARQMTLVVSTHQMDQAYRMADEVLSLRDGHMLKAGPTNLFHGRIEDSPEGTRVHLDSHVMLYTTASHRGSAYIQISPDDILVSKDPLASSARNSLKGSIAEASVEENRIRLDLDTGIRLTIYITRQSFAGLNLTVGNEIYATFKASAVRVV